MHCLRCAEKYGLPTESELRLTRCSYCSGQCACYSDRVADRKLLLEPREAIRNRIRSINTRLEKLKPLVEKYEALFIERSRLREQHLRLEHLLTDVKPRVVKAHYEAPPKKPDRRMKEVLRALTPAEKAQLVEMLKKRDKEREDEPC